MTPRQGERRRRILQTVQRLVAENGYEGTSMRTIASVSEVTEKTLYNIYGSKDQLFAIAVRKRSATAFENTALEKPQGGLDYLLYLPIELASLTLRNVKLSQAFSQVLLDNFELVGLDALYMDYVGGALSTMQEQGLIADDADIGKIVRQFSLAGVSGVLMWAKGKVGSDELAAYIHLQFISALLPHVTVDLQKQLLGTASDCFGKLQNRADLPHYQKV